MTEPREENGRRTLSAQEKRRFAIGAGCVALVLFAMLALPQLWDGPKASAPAAWAGVTFEYGTKAELERVMGFAVEEPGALPFSPEETVYENVSGVIAQLRVSGSGGAAVYRKARSSGGVFEDAAEHAETREVQRGGVTVTLCGDGGVFSLAQWERGEFTCGVRLEPAAAEETLLRAVDALLAQE